MFPTQHLRKGRALKQGGLLQGIDLLLTMHLAFLQVFHVMMGNLHALGVTEYPSIALLAVTNSKSRGPRLLLEFARGERHELHVQAKADTMSYLAKPPQNTS